MNHHIVKYTGKYRDVIYSTKDGKKYALKRFHYNDLPLKTDSLFFVPVTYDSIYTKYFQNMRFLAVARPNYSADKMAFVSFLATMDPNITLENYKEELKKYEQK